MSSRALCVLLSLVALPGALLAAAEPDAYSSVYDWAEQTNHTHQMAVTEAADPELASYYDDPSWVGTVFAISDQVWEVMARMDGLASFDSLLNATMSDPRYMAGMKMILEYNVLPEEALTYADLRALAAQRANLTTLLDGATVGTMLKEPSGRDGVLLIPEDLAIGPVTVLPGPGVFAGNATVLYVDKVLLPHLGPPGA